MSLAWYNQLFGVNYEPVDKDINNATFCGYLNGQQYAMNGSVSTVTVAANIGYAAPFVVYQLQAFNSVNVAVTAAAVGNGVIGIYTGRSGKPDQLIVTSAAFDSNSISTKNCAIPVTTLVPNVYWLVYLGNNASTLTAEAGTSNLVAYCGTSIFPSTNSGFRYNTGLTYPTLPSNIYSLPLSTSFVTPKYSMTTV
jgi:hypothetical protein